MIIRANDLLHKQRETEVGTALELVIRHYAITQPIAKDLSGPRLLEVEGGVDSPFPIPNWFGP